MQGSWKSIYFAAEFEKKGAAEPRPTGQNKKQARQSHALQKQKMKKYFNILPGDGRCTVLLYGEIGGDVRSGDVMRELLDAERRYGRIDVRINSVGGEVYAGIAIFNALRQSKADIHIYIDGIAASMASAIALCGKPVEMSRYARLMIHTVRGGCWGTKKDMADCIEQLEALEGTLCQMYAAKLGCSAEEIKEHYFDGEDHWLSAHEALAGGFIDGIYDVDAQAEPVPTEEMSAEEIYATFNNRLEAAAVVRQHTEQPQTENNMALLEELKKNPKFKDCASEEAALQIVAQLTQTAAAAETVAAENATLKAENQAFKDKEAQSFIAEKKKLLDDAEKCGKINAVTRPAFEALLESDYEKGKKALDDLRPTKRVMDSLDGSTPQESAWDKRKSQIQGRYEQGRYS